MHQIIIVLNNSQTNLMLSFKEKDEADLERTALHESMNEALSGEDSVVPLKDSYGHKGTLIASSIAAVLQTDVYEEYQANIQEKIIEAHAGQRLQRQMNADPLLKLAGGLNG